MLKTTSKNAKLLSRRQFELNLVSKVLPLNQVVKKAWAFLQERAVPPLLSRVPYPYI